MQLVKIGTYVTLKGNKSELITWSCLISREGERSMCRGWLRSLKSSHLSWATGFFSPLKIFSSFLHSEPDVIKMSTENKFKVFVRFSSSENIISIMRKFKNSWVRRTNFCTSPKSQLWQGLIWSVKTPTAASPSTWYICCKIFATYPF